MKKIFLLIALLILSKLSAQEPTLSGKIKISIQKGTIECELQLSDVPKIENYEILLNSEMNIKYIKDSKRKKNISFEKTFNSQISEESFLYSFPNIKQGKEFLPEKIDFKYAGKFPVFKDTTNLYTKGDWKGNIAFSDNTLRVDGNQTNWYPVLYDVDKDKRYDVLKYDITVKCQDCKTLYVNGNNPVNSKEHNFKTEIPSEIFLFVGDYETYKIDGTFFLNPDIDEEEMKLFAKTTEKFKNYYSNKLNIPYKRNITYIRAIPTSKKNVFLFVTYPTIVIIGRADYGLKFFVEDKNNTAKPFIAHELAHYYFGSGYRKFNSIIFGAIQEGFAEYMSFQASKEILGKQAYRKKLEKSILAVKNSRFLQISKIRKENDYGEHNNYVYNYFPLILMAIDKEIGEEKMWHWIKNILETKTEITNFKFLEQTFRNTLNNENFSDKIISKYFLSDNSLKNAIERIEKE